MADPCHKFDPRPCRAAKDVFGFEDVEGLSGFSLF